MLFITTSTILFGLHKSAVAISLGYRTSLFQMFERQDVEGSDAFIDYETIKDKKKLVRKRILRHKQRRNFATIFRISKQLKLGTIVL